MLCMKVWRCVIVVVHRNDDSQESANLGHVCVLTPPLTRRGSRATDYPVAVDRLVSGQFETTNSLALDYRVRLQGCRVSRQLRRKRS